jgi:internalin A
MNSRIPLAALALLTATALGLGQTITTVAGNGNAGSTGDGGAATSAALQPNGVAVDGAGNIYIADFATSVIRKVDTAGKITTVAGYATEPMQFTGDGVPATQSSIYILERHTGLAVDSAGNLYIADTGHFRIRKVDTA